MGGFVADAGFGVYAVSRFVVEGPREALAEELAPSPATRRAMKMTTSMAMIGGETRSSPCRT
jgi:hypothetical protein